MALLAIAEVSHHTASFLGMYWDLGTNKQALLLYCKSQVPVQIKMCQLTLLAIVILCLGVKKLSRVHITTYHYTASFLGLYWAFKQTRIALV